jgi:hypothetical protein
MGNCTCHILVIGNALNLFYNDFFFNKTQGLTFLSRNLYGWVGYPSDIKFQNSEFAVCCFVPGKFAVRFVLW